MELDAHGTYIFKKTDHILYVNAQGPFNEIIVQQYAHDIDEDTQNIEKDTTVPLDKADVTNINTTENVEFEDSDLDSEDLECDTCGKIFLEHHELSEHNMEGTCGYGCEDCGAYYRYEKDLKLHMQRHCTKCFDEFYPKSVLEAHNKVCTGIEY